MDNLKNKKQQKNRKMIQNIKTLTKKHKYDSIIFLSQKFQKNGYDSLLSNQKIREISSKIQDNLSKSIQKQLASKIITKTQNNQIGKPDRSSLLTVADKIRILRKPVYKNITKKAFHRFSTIFQNGNKTLFQKPCKIQKSLRQKTLQSQRQNTTSRILKTEADIQKSYLLNQKIGRFSLNKKLNEKRKQQLQDDKQVSTNRVKTELGVDQDNQQLSERGSVSKTNKKWICKSSFQKMEQDFEAEQSKRDKNSRKSTFKQKNVQIPRSSLYMSMFLRSRDSKIQQNKSQLNRNNMNYALQSIKSGLSQNHSQKHISKKIKIRQGILIPKQLHEQQICFGLTSNRVLNPMAISQKSNNFLQNKNKVSAYLQIQKLKKPYSDKKLILVQRGPTIAIDPW